MSATLVQRLRESVTQCRALDRSALLEEAAAEIERLRLTDAEREAIECGIQAIGLAPRDDRTLAFADTLQRLLERTK